MGANVFTWTFTFLDLTNQTTIPLHMYTLTSQHTECRILQRLLKDNEHYYMCVHHIHDHKNKSIGHTQGRKKEYACNNMPLHNHNTGEKIQWCSETGRPINYSFRLKCFIKSIELNAAFDFCHIILCD